MLAAASWPNAWSMKPRPYNAELEDELDQWEDARNRKDYETADYLRDGLRARGVSPAKERPARSSVEDELQRWHSAKQAKDYSRSDRIRDSLRAQGVDPDSAGRGGFPLTTFVAAPPMHTPRRANPSFSTFGADTNNEVSRWYDAKDRKDWSVADKIREGLRARGIEPAECPRPHSPSVFDRGMQDELKKWYEARDAKNWAVADEIRERFRAQGIEPAHCDRPTTTSSYGKAPGSGGSSRRSAPYSVPSSFDHATEQQLDEWWEAKQQKNYETADAIRAELRAQGIEPDKYRSNK